MGTFNGNTLQTTDGAAIAESVDDYQLPAMGVLQLNLIKSPTGLTNTNGVDCKLIHGDLWEQIGLPGVAKYGLLGVDGTPIIAAPPSPRGNVTVNVHGNTTCTMNGNVTYTVQPYVSPVQQFETAPNAGFTSDNPIGITVPSVTSGAVTFTVEAGGSFTEMEYGPVTRTFMQPVSEFYNTDLMISQPENNSFSNLQTNNTTVGETCFVGGVVFNFVGLQGDAFGVHGELTGCHAELMPMHAETTLLHIGSKDVKTFGKMFEADATAAKAEVSTQTNCTAETNAGVHLGGGHLP